MNSRVSWSVDGIDPNVRVRAEAVARSAGMSLNDWLNSTIHDAPPANYRARPDQRPSPNREVADIHQRLDSITRQIEQISHPAPRQDVARGEPEMVRGEPQAMPGEPEAFRSEPQAGRSEPQVARQLNDAISRLDARLSQISNPGSVRKTQIQDSQRQADLVERAAANVYRPAPPANPAPTNSAFAPSYSSAPSYSAAPSPAYSQSPVYSPGPAAAQSYSSSQSRSFPPNNSAPLDFAIAEIAARQHELEQTAMRQMPPMSAPPTAPAMPTSPAMSASPAMPAGPDFSSLERHLFKITSQIEALQRPDGIEQSIKAFRGELADIRHTITEAMPRRAIESIENEIRALSRRIDDTRQSGIDSNALSGVERALSEIREVLRSLTPAEQLAGYDEAIRNLGGKLDLILRSNDDPGTVKQLEGAIATLRAIVSNVASNDALARLSEDVHTLSSKVDQLNKAAGSGDSFAALEQRIAALTSSLEGRERPAATESSAQLESLLRSLSDRLDRMPVGNDNASAFMHLEQRVSYLLERIENSAEQPSGHLGRVEDGLQDVLRHLKSQHASFTALADNSRDTSQPADGGIVDIVKRELSDLRFNQSESDRRAQDSLEAVHNTLGHVVDRLAMIEGDLRGVRPLPLTPSSAPAFEAPAAAPRLAMPPQLKPELPNPAAAQEHFASAPREFHAAPSMIPAVTAATSKAITDILEPYAASPAESDIGLPPDHPLEPGTRPGARTASPSERIAASESAISEIPAAPREPVNPTNFIAAARRAAQAAAAAPVADKGRASAKKAANDTAKGPKEPSTIGTKIRSLMVGASVVIIVLGTFKLAMNFLDSGSAPPVAMDNSIEPVPAPMGNAVGNAAGNAAKPAAPAPATPSMTSPTPIGKQSYNNAAPDASNATASVAIPPASSTPPFFATDVTGSIPTVPKLPSKLTAVPIPANEMLPDAIGGPALRAAALKGDASAAYEIGVRFAEGKGVAASYDDAAKWYARAAQAGVVPAIFRLGTFYEKGLSVKKDADTARRYYIQAAERGNAKAMHNLAVLDADGGGKGANYKSAAEWFRKAADHGVADSQFNLGILYARGIGVEQNLAESFKWFSLAAAQGDADAAHKRDDIAKRLDVQSLAAAKLAIQTFTAEPQPDDAVNVTAPAGGWDNTNAQASAAKPAAKLAAAKPVLAKRTVAAAAH